MWLFSIADHPRPIVLTIVNIMEWLPEYRKTVNSFVNPTILDARTFNNIVNIIYSIDNINERVRPAIDVWIHASEFTKMFE